MSRSLVGQLLRRLLVASGIALLATAFLLWWQFENAAGLILDRGLGDAIEEIGESLVISENGHLSTKLSPESLARFNESYFFTVADAHGRALLSIPAGRAHTFHSFESHHGDAPQFFEHNDLHSGQNHLGVTAPVVIDKQVYWVQLVEQLPHWQNFLHYSLQIYLSGIGVIIILHFAGSSLLAYRTLRGALAPVEAAAAQTRKIGPGKRGMRIDAGDLPAEVVPLAGAVNSALERLERALLAQRRFTADAAHELLTPLAIIKADLDAIQDRALADTLSNDLQDMVEIVTQLLELSEIESEERPPDQLFDLGEVARDVVMRFAPMAIKRGIEPEITGAEEPVHVRGCPKAMTSAIGNLVKNALAHAAGATRLVVAVEHGGTVSVTDDGPGIPKDLRERIFERFQRLPGAKAPGKGLGLAIVERIVAAHGGTIAVEDGPGGKGARFVIQLRR